MFKHRVPRARALGLVVGLVFGAVVGFYAGNYLRRDV